MCGARRSGVRAIRLKVTEFALHGLPFRCRIPWLAHRDDWLAGRRRCLHRHPEHGPSRPGAGVHRSPHARVDRKADHRQPLREALGQSGRAARARPTPLFKWKAMWSPLSARGSRPRAKPLADGLVIGRNSAGCEREYYRLEATLRSRKSRFLRTRRRAAARLHDPRCLSGLPLARFLLGDRVRRRKDLYRGAIRRRH